MNKINLLLIAALILIVASCSQNKKTDKSKEIESKISEVMSKMTLEEKGGQMTEITIDILLKTENGKIVEPQELDTAKFADAIKKYKVGSILNVANHAYTRDVWYKIQSLIQKNVNQTNLKIPVIYGIDAIHGVNYTIGSTLFPQQIAMAASWNPELVERGAAITAYETRASYIPWVYSPVCDLGRNPLWSRLWETFGEDVYLASELNKSMVKGFQGTDVSDKFKVAACLKHFLGYSFPLSGKDRTPAWIPDRYLREYFLPTFDAAIKEGAWTVMVNSSEINGIPVHASSEILTDLLKNELNFQGFAVSDWSDIKNLYEVHKIAESHKDAVRIAVNAGIDMSMVPIDYSFYEYLVELVNEGKVPMSRIDDAVRRILRVKYYLGLFDKTFYEPQDYPDFGSEKFKKESYNATCEVITLLKNKNNILPLSKSTKVLVTGPTANSMNCMNGGWSYNWQGDLSDEYAKEYNTVLEAITKEIGEANVKSVQDKYFDDTKKVEEAVALAKASDVIVLCLGEFNYTEMPGNIDNLSLPWGQINLAKELAKTGKPVIVVLLEGRPRLISSFEEVTSAVLTGYLPGNFGGDAIADVIFGDVNPSGKLPYTYPRYPNALVNYDHKFSEEGQDKNFTPQYEFGFGLSYTNFEYSNLKLSAENISTNDTLLVSVDVKNAGGREGKEVVQLYISDLVASITPAVKRLRGFKKVNLKSGESQTITFKITSKNLEFVDINNKWKSESGEFKIQIEKLNKKFNLK